MAGAGQVARGWDLDRIIKNYEQRINTLEKLAGGSSGLTLLLNPPACRVTNAAVQALTNGVQTPLTFDTERWDTDSMHDPGTPTRITINTAGLYSCGGSVRVQNAADYSQINLRVRVNGATDIVHSDLLVSASAAIAQVKNVSTDYLFAAGDFITLEVTQNNAAAAARNTVVNPQWAPEFWATRKGSGT